MLKQPRYLVSFPSINFFYNLFNVKIYRYYFLTPSLHILNLFCAGFHFCGMDDGVRAERNLRNGAPIAIEGEATSGDGAESVIGTDF